MKPYHTKIKNTKPENPRKTNQVKSRDMCSNLRKRLTGLIVDESEEISVHKPKTQLCLVGWMD